MTSGTGNRRLSAGLYPRARTAAVLALASACLLFLCIDGALCEERPKAGATRTRKGLRFAVPDDWPIEERGGILGPIPVEEYVAGKFKDIESRMELIDAKLRDIEAGMAAVRDDMASRLEEMRSEISALNEDLINRSEENKAGVDALTEYSRNIRYSLDDVESKLADTRTVIDGRLRALRKKFDFVDKKIRSMQFYIDGLLGREAEE